MMSLEEDASKNGFKTMARFKSWVSLCQSSGKGFRGTKHHQTNTLKNSRFDAKNGELEDDFPGDVNVPAVNFQRCNFKFGSLQYY